MAIKDRRGTAAEWTAANPTLGDGETGFVRDQNRTKVGNGTTAWNDLPYLGEGSDVDLVAVFRAALTT